MWDPYAEFESATLPNGLTVHAAYWPGRPWEAMGFLIHSGAEHDPIGLEGLAHFVEHVVSENTSVSLKEMIAFFEDCGGGADFGVTYYPGTRYRFFVPTDKAVLSRAFSMFGHMLLSAKIEKFIERERQVIITEFNRCYPVKFKYDLDMREHKALYQGHWLERSVQPLGTPESVGRITQKELRSYYDANYTPANMSVVGVGGMQLPELVELLSESPFADRKEGVRTPLPIPGTDVAPPSENRYVFEISKHVSSPFGIGRYESKARIPGNTNGRVLSLLQDMLDEVLKEEVRERRAWAYTIGSSRHNFRDFYKLSITCDSLALEALDDVEGVIEICIASIADREDLFEQVKRRALAGNSMVDSTGCGVRNDALSDLANIQRIMSLAEIGNDLERVTMDDIRSALKWLRPERRWTLIVRP